MRYRAAVDQPSYIDQELISYRYSYCCYCSSCCSSCWGDLF